MIIDLTDMRIPWAATSAPPDRSWGSRAGVRELALRIGFDMHFDVTGPAPTAFLLMLYAHPDVAPQLDAPERLAVDPALDLETFVDAFGNTCGRLVAPPGPLRVSHAGVFRCAYENEPQPEPSARQHHAGDRKSVV